MRLNLKVNPNLLSSAIFSKVESFRLRPHKTNTQKKKKERKKKKKERKKERKKRSFEARIGDDEVNVPRFAVVVAIDRARQIDTTQKIARPQLRYFSHLWLLLLPPWDILSSINYLPSHACISLQLGTYRASSLAAAESLFLLPFFPSIFFSRKKEYYELMKKH